jgi:hypothetical protein
MPRFCNRVIDDGVSVAGQLVGLQRCIKAALLKLGPAHHIVGVGVTGVFPDQVLQRADGLGGLALVEQGAGNPQLGPGQGLGVDHRLVQFLRLVIFAHAQQQLGTHPRGVQPELAPGDKTA